MNQKKTSQKKLRTGFSTGACAAAAAVAAWKSLHGATPDSAELLFPDNKVRSITIHTAINGTATVIKDAGDDIDCTNRAEISAAISSVEPEAIREADFVEPCGKATVVLRGENGIGKVTRRGLDVPVGKSAINPVPRQMILGHLEKAGLGTVPGAWLIELSIKNGKKLAAKTLNPTLGIIGGLSILGTSGLVIPCSNASYIATIDLLLRGAHEYGERTAVLVTGGRTHRILRTLHPDIDESAFVRFGDFIQVALQLCEKYRYEHVIIGCMPGKLAKYAMGHTCTHAHTVEQSMTKLAERFRNTGLPAPLCQQCKTCCSIREFLDSISPEESLQVIDILKQKAAKNLTAWAGSSRAELCVLNFKGEKYE